MTSDEKRYGLISGLIGGSIASVLGVLFLRQGTYILNAISRIFQGLPISTYRSFYTLEQAGVYFLIVGLVFCLITIIFWMLIGTGYGILIYKQEWSKKKILYAWLLWGMSVPLSLVSFTVMLMLWEGNNLDVWEDYMFLRDLSIWWSISGLTGGLASAVYLTRCYGNNKR